ncbi:MAG: 4Fe-4S binding protein [Acidobacteria bacterium]|nr:4Fe-4S binding protein [Acidobacteriota bacterium]
MSEELRGSLNHPNAGRLSLAPSRTGDLHLLAARCKGCELCVWVCPVRSLVLGRQRNRRGYRLPELRDLCIHCGECQAICPELALIVTPSGVAFSRFIREEETR